MREIIAAQLIALAKSDNIGKVADLYSLVLGECGSVDEVDGGSW